MKLLTILLTITILQVKGYVIQVPTSLIDVRPAPMDWVHIQKMLLSLFENVCEESTDPIVGRLSEEFKSDPTSGIYLKPDVIDGLQNLKAGKGLLPKGTIFTEYDEQHLNELKIIYEVLFYAKDFDTFYKAACWARQNVNCGLFVDAIYLAILNRRDTEKISIPAPYELLPNYFVRKDFILKASSLLRGDITGFGNYVRDVGNSYILDVNYTNSFSEEGDDQLAYFHEDIGLNSYFYLTKLKTIDWIGNLRSQNDYGQYLYHTIKQMMARYNLERYSNGLPELEGINWDYVSDSSYDPMLLYSNGKEFSRSSTYGDIETIRALKNIENNIPAVVIHMRDGGYNKSQIITHLMEIFVTGDNSYEKQALKLLNGDKSISSEPSVLGHFMTTARDPLFWKIWKKIVDTVDSALQILPSYTRNELYFPGVEVQNVEVKKMITAFEDYEFDVTSALKTKNEDTKFQIKISQSRLSSKPFSIKISVSSFVAQKAVVKLYIGPKVMPGQLIEKKNMLMLLDCFEYNLKIGTNLITRLSHQMMKLSGDFISLETIRKKIFDAEFGVVDTLSLKPTWAQTGFPSRLVLPKGSAEGLPINVFVFIAPYVKPVFGGSRGIAEINNDATFSPGYPLDLNVDIQQLFTLPNSFVKDFVITHKADSYSKSNKPTNTYNPNSGRVWQIDNPVSETRTGLLSLADRPEFTKRTFDYKAKQNNYGKKSEYPSNKARSQYQKYERYNSTNGDTIKEENKENEQKKVEIINNIYITPGLDTESASKEDINIDNKTPFNEAYQNDKYLTD